ncbi:MAG: hypothetical protein F6K53_34280 [Moorea sp. SIO4A1]|nr:hypothetical protein [Moorena sp. SIO4A1]
MRGFGNPFACFPFALCPIFPFPFVELASCQWLLNSPCVELASCQWLLNSPCVELASCQCPE